MANEVTVAESLTSEMQKLIHGYWMWKVRQMMDQAQHWLDEGSHPLAVHHRVMAAESYYQVAVLFDPARQGRGFDPPLQEMAREMANPNFQYLDAAWPPTLALHDYRSAEFVAKKMQELRKK